MKSILVPVENHDLIESTLETAWRAAEHFSGHIEGFALRALPDPFITPDSVAGAMVYAATVTANTDAVREAREVFMAAMERRGTDAAGVSFAWLEEEGPYADSFVGTRGRVFDVIVLGRPTTAATGPRRTTLEAALFDSGRPVLIAPPDPAATFGEVLTVAWNKSAETARTVAFALPLLHRAKRTVIVAMEGGHVSGPSGEDLARYLGRNGIATEVVRIERSSGRGMGIAILEKAAEFGSDLLVKGAFTQSPISQLIFGGATREILAEANLPVFMAH